MLLTNFISSGADILTIVLLILVIVLIVLMVMQSRRVKYLTHRYNRFMKGKKAQTLEGLLEEKIGNVDNVVKRQEEIDLRCNAVVRRYNDTYQKVGIVKYNALPDAAGKLSFSLALLNGNNDGFVINVVHGPEGCYTYMKEIEDGASASVLGPEEEEAVKRAVESGGRSGLSE